MDDLVTFYFSSFSRQQTCHDKSRWHCFYKRLHLDQITFQAPFLLSAFLRISPDEPDDLAGDKLRVEAEERCDPGHCLGLVWKISHHLEKECVMAYTWFVQAWNVICKLLWSFETVCIWTNWWLIGQICLAWKRNVTVLENYVVDEVKPVIAQTYQQMR